MTAPPEAARELAERLRARCGLRVTEVGRITEEVPSADDARVEVGGLPAGAVPPAGWDHFRGRVE